VRVGQLETWAPARCGIRCVDERADAVGDGEPVEEDDAASLAECECSFSAARAEFERSCRLEPGRRSYTGQGGGRERLSRDEDERRADQAGFDERTADPHEANTSNPAERVLRSKRRRPLGGVHGSPGCVGRLKGEASVTKRAGQRTAQAKPPMLVGNGTDVRIDPSGTASRVRDSGRVATSQPP
jgi:hypothetical protein